MSSTATLTLPGLPDVIGQIQERMLRDYALAVDDWSRAVNTLSQLERQHLMDDDPPPAVLLAAHKGALERMIRFGKWFQLSSTNPDFPDHKTADIVDSTMSLLQDKLAMWHGPKMSEEESEKILRECGLV